MNKIFDDKRIKKYIFFTFGISNIGGAELYMRQKLLYVKSLGFEPLIIYVKRTGPVYINEFMDLSFAVPEIAYPPKFFLKNKRKKILGKILSIIGDVNKETIIESHLVHLAMWGELAASVFSGTNFLYLLSENYPFYANSIYDFLKFKFMRRELVGINEHTLQLLFKNNLTLTDEQCYYLEAWMGDSIENIPSALINVIDSSATLKIGCYGRLEKLYVQNTIKCVKSYCVLNPKVKVQLILIGGTHDCELLKKYQKMLYGIPNLSLYITGFIYPVPLSFMKKMDFVIAGSGAAESAVRNSLLTVSMDIYGNPIGILGISTQNSMERDKYDCDSGNLLDYFDRFREKIYNADDISSIEPYPNLSIEFGKHMDFIKSGNPNKEYFDTTNIGSIYKSIMYKFLGMKYYSVIEKYVIKLKEYGCFKK